ARRLRVQPHVRGDGAHGAGAVDGQELAEFGLVDVGDGVQQAPAFAVVAVLLRHRAQRADARIAVDVDGMPDAGDLSLLRGVARQQVARAVPELAGRAVG